MNKGHFMYRIPVYCRFVSLTENAPYTRSRWVCLDGIGLLAYYEKEEDLKPENIRRHLIGRKLEFITVEASSPKHALEKFRANYEGAYTGDRGASSKGLIIASDEEILEYPPCSLMHSGADADLLCGTPEPDRKNGQYGHCVLSGFDAPDFFCPIDDFWSREDEVCTDKVEAYTVRRGSHFKMKQAAGSPIEE